MSIFRRGIAVLAVVAAGAMSADAAIGTHDTVPAATLLLPYFEADLADASVNTTFVVRNANPAATVAHVTLFTDYAAPSFSFDVYLTGFQTRRFDMRDILVHNSLNLGEDTLVEGDPILGPTEDALFADGFETGDFSGWTSHVADISIGDLRAYHSGQTGPRTGLCAGHDHGDTRARGYIVINNVVQFGAGFPHEPGYFDNGAGIASNENMLTGEYAFYENFENFSYGASLVHIEASGSDPLVTTVGNYTFFGAAVNGSADDNREPLASVYAARCLTGGPFVPGTTLVYWRDPKVVQMPFVCGTAPAWFPLQFAEVVAFDEQSNSALQQGTDHMPLACGRVAAGSSEFPIPLGFLFGWLHMDFSAVPDVHYGNVSQAHVSVMHRVQGRFAPGHAAMPLNNVSDLIP